MCSGFNFWPVVASAQNRTAGAKTLSSGWHGPKIWSWESKGTPPMPPPQEIRPY